MTIAGEIARSLNVIDLRSLFRSLIFRSLVVLSFLQIGCVTVGQITNLSEPNCYSSLTSGFSSILEVRSEARQIAETLASETAHALVSEHYGPRLFLVSSPSGADYTFFIEKDDGRCLLQLYGVQKGFYSYTNNLTYIETRPLSGCQCSE